MRYWLKVFGLVLVAAVLMGVSFVAGAVLQPRSILKVWISKTERNAALKQMRLSHMLRQGMTPNEVKEILGEPSEAKDVENGLRWFYWWQYAGEGIVVEFRHHGPVVFKGEARLCYAHIFTGAFSFFPDTDPNYFTIGRPLTSR